MERKYSAPLAEASVPRFIVIVGRSCMKGCYYAMCGKSFEPDIIIAPHTGEIYIMEPEDTVYNFYIC